VLRQAFTVGERWPLSPRRAARLVSLGAISNRRRPALRLGTARSARISNLKLLERRDGYRGFNQQGISHIIRRTDPRASAE
jgi:hypothetical protein